MIYDMIFWAQKPLKAVLIKGSHSIVTYINLLHIANQYIRYSYTSGLTELYLINDAPQS